MQTLCHQIIVVWMANKIEAEIRDFVRKNGDQLKSMGVNVKEFQLEVLDLVGEAYEALKTRMQLANKRKAEAEKERQTE